MDLKKYLIDRSGEIAYITSSITYIWWQQPNNQYVMLVEVCIKNKYMIKFDRNSISSIITFSILNCKLYNSN